MVAEIRRQPRTQRPLPKEQMPSGREEIPWSIMAAVLVLARFCAPSSERQIAESWYDKTALDDLLGVRGDKISDDRLYRGLWMPCFRTRAISSTIPASNRTGPIGNDKLGGFLPSA